MAFTRFTGDLNIHQSLPNEPTTDGGITAEELKRLFDKAPNDLKLALNGLIGQLEDGSSAKSLGADLLTESDTSENNIQSKLKYLLEQIQGVTQGAVADNSITEAKLNSEFLREIKDLISLGGKYNNPTFSVIDGTTKMAIDNVLSAYENGTKVDMFINPSFENFGSNIFPTDMTSNFKDGFEVSATAFGSASTQTLENCYQALNGAGCRWGYHTGSANRMEMIVKTPLAIKPSNFYAKLSYPSDNTSYHDNGTLTIYASNDGEHWEQIATQSFQTSSSAEVKEFNIAYSGDKYYKIFKISLYRSSYQYSNYLYYFNITSGEKSLFNDYLPQTLKIGNLAEIPLNGKVESFKKESLVYMDGKFIATERGGIF